MTHREELRAKVEDAYLVLRSYRVLGEQIGISHTTVGDFLRDPDSVDDSTVKLIERWATGNPVGKRTTAPRLSLKQKAAAYDVLAGYVRAMEGDEIDPTDAAERRRVAAATAAIVKALRSLED